MEIASITFQLKLKTMFPKLLPALKLGSKQSHINKINLPNPIIGEAHK